ncbi:MAG TPA: PIN domain-containing protein [Acidobacteriaceae bacterium]
MLVYLDTNIWVYAYENDPTFGPAARKFMHSLRSGKHRLAGSLFVLNELLVLPTRRDDSFTIASYRQLFASPNLELLPYTLASAKIYAQLRAFDRIKPLDALHLATAAAARVDLFITHDTKLLSCTVPGLGAIADTTFVLP